MNVQRKENQKGFTIIEVVLVLAIAGLIFLMVFIALPALQRNQRDTQRKNDLSRAQTAINNYQTNNRNQLPNPATGANWNTKIRDQYLKAGGVNGDTFQDPKGEDYQFAISNADPTFAADTPTVINVALANTCNGEALAPAGVQKVALRMKLEGGGIACVNN
jgi:prepilin-type N-terminal cleavage/methylation domain-containing protein